MKRLFDLIGATAALVLLSPALAIAALCVKLGDGGPVFFFQERIGRGGRPFTMWKLRTMAVDAAQSGGGVTIAGDPRITRAGAWLRRYKLDELPQLWNVIKGDMSLVGPRPELACYVQLYTPQQREVVRLRPGITDPASLRFRREAELLAGEQDPERVYRDVILPEKIRLSLEYGRRASVWTDLLVILRTLRRVAA